MYKEANQYPYHDWTAPTHMIWNGDNILTENMVEIFKYLTTSGFDLKQAISQVPLPYYDNLTLTPPEHVGNILQVALHKHQMDLLSYLFSVDWQNVWSRQNFYSVLSTCQDYYQYQSQLVYATERVLNSDFGRNVFLSLPVTERFNLVQRLYNNFGKSFEITKILAQKCYAPYLLLLLTERDTFMKANDFTLYNEALTNVTTLELDVIANTSDEH